MANGCIVCAGEQDWGGGKGRGTRLASLQENNVLIPAIIIMVP